MFFFFISLNVSYSGMSDCRGMSGSTAPANGSVDISGPQPLGTVATYSCDYGLASGDLVRYCITGGTWTGTEPTCVPG